VEPCASPLDTTVKYPSNKIEKAEIHLNDGNGDFIYLINRTGQNLWELS
jgi:hypothetical protein